MEEECGVCVSKGPHPPESELQGGGCPGTLLASRRWGHAAGPVWKSGVGQFFPGLNLAVALENPRGTACALSCLVRSRPSLCAGPVVQLAVAPRTPFILGRAPGAFPSSAGDFLRRQPACSPETAQPRPSPARPGPAAAAPPFPGEPAAASNNAIKIADSI